ncbi:MAG: hypothetical protein JST12_09425 [Armatimonadetes bacterium]|nr:hypothetical protein [Armatimonadota bacterium]
MNPVTFVISLFVTFVFVCGSWCIVRAFGEAGKANSLGAAANFAIGLGLKFPGVIYVLKIAKSTNTADVNGAIAGVCLVYFSTVVGMAVYGFRQNRRTDDEP